MAEVDERLADLAVAEGRCTRIQADEALAELRRLTDLGLDKRVGDLFVERGVLTADLRDRLIAAVQRNPLARLVPGYEILEPVGKGGMGVVYKARHLGLDKIVAIKVLPPKFAADPQFVDRFLREARAAGRLNHEHIVHAIDAGEHKGHYYYVMEFVEGETAKARLRRQGPYSEADGVELLRQMGEALAHVHRHGLIHRDVKPENVIYTKDGTAKLCDLGLARVASEEASAGSKMSTFGTPLYISPEQIVTPLDLDGRCDLYSLGASIYHCVANTAPWRGETKAETVAGHLSPDPAPLASTHNPALTPGFCRVLAHLLQKNRDQRYLSAEALLADLADLRAGRRPTHAGGGPSRGAPRPLVIAAGAGGLALTAGLLAAFGWGGGTPVAVPTGTTTAPVTTPATVPATVAVPDPLVPPAPVPGAAEFATLRSREAAEPVPSVALCDAYAALLLAHPQATWRADAEERMRGCLRTREGAAAEALRQALAAAATAALEEAAARYPDTRAGRAATAAAAFRVQVARDEAAADVIAAARGVAAGEAGAETRLATAGAGAPEVAAALRRAAADASAAREADIGAMEEARYHGEIAPAVWRLITAHRFTDAKLAALSGQASLTVEAVRDLAGEDVVAAASWCDRLEEAVRGELRVRAGKPGTTALTLASGHKVRGRVEAVEGGFRLVDEAGAVHPVNPPDLHPDELAALSRARAGSHDYVVMLGRGVVFYAHAQDEAAKKEFKEAVETGASQPRLKGAIVLRDAAGASAAWREAGALLAVGDAVGARMRCFRLLRDDDCRATPTVRTEGDAIRALLAKATAAVQAGHAARLVSAAAAAEVARGPGARALDALRAARRVGDPAAVEGAALRLAEDDRAGAPRHLARAMEGAPPPVIAALAPAWRRCLQADPPADAAAAWIALAKRE